ncbi:hypothetical protein Mal64_08400 [Pseudobythopirellula maris]|uniref:Uncharacterized protein n=1 Tax=Pseudobythopirellula maris TaxID=2527991 RepID=A0A5C5ZU86_9BACT|nr:hypothetical protein [Pseudobythopirellula maris]TWT90451.1 hypothetical protein Mal64_08400 [Pseudobythopirellula maris]
MAASRAKRKALLTPDGRYIVVDGRLWRATNPAIPADERESLVRELMSARRAVKAAADDPEAMRIARQRVDSAKVRLGERGPVWWEDGQPDLNRRKVENTPYADWRREQTAG